MRSIAVRFLKKLTHWRIGTPLATPLFLITLQTKLGLFQWTSVRYRRNSNLHDDLHKNQFQTSVVSNSRFVTCFIHSAIALKFTQFFLKIKLEVFDSETTKIKNKSFSLSACIYVRRLTEIKVKKFICHWPFVRYIQTNLWGLK